MPEITKDKESKIEKLKTWILSELGSVDKFINVLEEDSSPEEHRLVMVFYTNCNSYQINAVERKADDGYLGCQVSCRKPRVGENWTRGSDLPDGKFTREIWEKIKDKIIQREMVKIEKQKNFY